MSQTQPTAKRNLPLATNADAEEPRDSKQDEPGTSEDEPAPKKLKLHEVSTPMSEVSSHGGLNEFFSCGLAGLRTKGYSDDHLKKITGTLLDMLESHFACEDNEKPYYIEIEDPELWSKLDTMMTTEDYEGAIEALMASRLEQKN
jgi:hypothetical protein